MARGPSTRRQVLRTAVGLPAATMIGGFAGCQALVGDGGTRSDTAVLEGVPADAVACTHVDASGLLADDQLVAGIDQTLGLGRGVTDAVPDSTEAVIDRLEGRLGLDPRGLDSLVAFAAREEQDEEERESTRFEPFERLYGAALVETDWATAAVREALGTRFESIEERTHAGRAVLVGGQLWAAVLGDGDYLVGSPAGVRAAVGVRDGAESATDTGLRRALGRARSAPVRVGIAPRVNTRPGGAFGNPIALLAGKIDFVSGSVYRDADRRGVELALETGSRFDAEDVHESVESVLALARSGTIAPNFKPLFEELSTRRNGTSVLVSYEAPPASFATVLVSVVANALLGE